MKSMTDEQRFFARVRQIDGDPVVACWSWVGTKTNGYGKFDIKAGESWRSTWTHRWSWEFFRGPIPEGLQLDHLCANRACVNPDHLEAVSQSVNAGRALRGRWGDGKRCQRGHDWMDPEIGYLWHTKRQCRVCRAMRQRGEEL